MRKIIIHTLCAALSFPCFAAPLGGGVERIINVAVNANLPPYQFSDGRGLAGAHIAILDKIASDRNYRVRYFLKDSDAACLAALRKGDVDAILGVNRVNAAGPGIAVSDILTSTSLCMVVRSDLMRRNQQEKRPFPTSAAVELDSAPYTMISNLGITTYLALGDQQRVFDALRDGTVDAAVAVKDCALFRIDQVGGSDRFTIIHNYLGYVSYAVALRAEDRELLRVLNDGISRIRAGHEYEAILKRWLVADEDPRLWRTLRSLGVAFAVALLVSGAYVFISLRIRTAMKRQVEAQTEEIQEANRKLERQLRQIRDENDLRNSIIKYSPNAMILVGADRRVGLMNKSAQLMTGVSRGGGGAPLQSLPVFREVVEKAGPRVFEPGAAVENGRLRLNSKSYRYTMHQVILDGEISGVLIMVQDVTKEDQEAQVEFEKDKNRSLARLVAGIAHEIRNPLMSIRTFATVIGSRGEDREVQRSFAEYVPGEVDRINRLIENMICYSKPANRQVGRCEVAGIVQECVGLISPSISSKGIRLSTGIGEGLAISVDRDQVKQVLINLLINSVEAIERKLAQSDRAELLDISVRAWDVDDSVILEVRDEGSGMTAEELRCCAEPFYTTKGTGTGLGLTLCKQYLEENAARLDVTSEEGRYTRITITFPRSPREVPNPDSR